ncbi:MAG: N-acetylmuramoyl-L-alanine amidase [Rhodobacterales bacterium]|nr:MAG: N-acetylmuramoyl-L-alanine amidase [Rhodobacterales bacterium]
MYRRFRILAGLWAAVLVLCAGAVLAQQTGFSALARVDVEDSRISGDSKRLSVKLDLTQGVPFRVFTLTDPARVVLDFREVDWRGLDAATLWPEGRVRFGGFRPGWSRMVIDLPGPMGVKRADMTFEENTGAAQLRVGLSAISAEEFARVSKPPKDPGWTLERLKAPAVGEKDRVIVVIDPGHGGIDPGAERGGTVEKQLTLTMARELREALLRVDGIEVHLTREDDYFVSLERRVAIAHQKRADLFLSLHADALSEGNAHGATVYTLAEEASDRASALLAERHDRSDMLAGVNLIGQDDIVADVLLDLARIETRPRTQKLSEAMVLGLQSADVPMNSKPYRAAAFSVLKAADIPSVLIEVGFMSSARDLENLRDPAWRAGAVAGMRDGIQAWIIADTALRKLVRQ